MLRLEQRPGIQPAFGGAAEPLLAIADRCGHRSAVLYLTVSPADLARVGSPAAQERLLSVVESRLAEVLRESDLIARSGATAFMLLLSHLWEPEGCFSAVERIVAGLARPWTLDGAEHELGTCLGVAVRPEDATELRDLLAQAVDAAAAAGAEGLSFRFANVAMEEQLRWRDELRRSLGSGAPRGQFLVDYQPIFSLATDEVVGVESLIRWNHPRLGLIPAGAFVPEAERTGRIRSMDRWIVRQAMAETGEWQRSGWSGFVSVNLSGQTISDTRTLGHLRQALRTARDQGARGVVEITESAALSKPAETSRFLSEVRELGIEVAVDDFGTGYSSLEYISLFDADIIKLDRSFLAGVEQEPRKRKLLEGLLKMTRHMGMPVVAEGVESEIHKEILGEAGCEMIQGHHCARPMPPEEFADRYLAA